MLGLAELLVILSGRGGIDLSVGAIVSLAGMVFGFAYGEWGWPLWLAILLTALFGGAAAARSTASSSPTSGFPALIATLATYYAYKSLAIVINDQSPISTPPIQELFSITRSVELPVFGPVRAGRAAGPVHVPAARPWSWSGCCSPAHVRPPALRRSAPTTSPPAGPGCPVRGTRFKAYVYAGLISGLVAVVTVAQFASARPDAGVSGNGMALPAITIAVLGGVAITGGIGRVAGVVLATLLIVWLNAGILLAFVGNEGSPVPAARPRRRAGLRRPAQRAHHPPLRRHPLTDRQDLKDSTDGPRRPRRLHHRGARAGPTATRAPGSRCSRRPGVPRNPFEKIADAAQVQRRDRAGAAGVAAHPVGQGRRLRRARRPTPRSSACGSGRSTPTCSRRTTTSSAR